ncbi:DUF3566 domain-containing protein [Nonomuraea roseoviolacea subsp. roseoviolacea]|uniref:Flp pilus assembly pilin Flp n=1 Tax=Nonomuraea roseoviolacea subsp. carminata TaxID=160689 RepID=A0ABT1K024_9ACTN|nr:DUF3566 domain-containing protein [Nonomuraea roseoviolacea]MCP2347356.1 Flp pilus assembly pilin Flp [Nonomuraea roseoviolacea subsp. carminata]
MSAQGGSPSARTKAARDNGQKPKKSVETETFDKPEEDNATAVHPMPTAPQSSSTPQAGPKPAPAGAKPGQAEQDGKGSGIRPSLTSEAPPQLELSSSSSKKKSSSGARLPRKAHLVLRRIEPWSAMKFSFVVSLVCFVVLFVAVAVLYGVLNALGVFDSIVDLVNQLGQGEQGQTALPIDIASWFEPVRILGYTALIGAVNVVLITALSTLGAVIYNVASDLVGGVEVTFSEAE